MFQYKIEKIIFNDKSEIIPGNLTVIVGPNNCGKSRILKDIKSLTSERINKSVIISDIEYSLPSSVEDLTKAYDITTFTDLNNNIFLRTLSSNLVSQHSVNVGVDWEQNLQNILIRKNNTTKSTFSHWFGSFFVSLFETEERLKMAKESQSSEDGQLVNLLQAFYQEGPAIEEKLRKIVKEAFGKDIKLDYSTLRKILFRIGDDFSDCPEDPREAISYFKACDKLDEQGDGLRSFVATLLALLVGKRPVLLLDEPESFLHPPQAYRLGEIIAEQAVNERQVFIATHSSELLRGILSKRQDITLVRVNRIGNVNKLNVLDSKQVATISSDPLLSSTRIMEGLFYKGAIIVEADADAVFYQRIARQLKNADNFHIAHAHNKQTVAKVLPPYKALGIPFSAIVDFDIIRVKNEFKNLLQQFTIPANELEHALELQSKIVDYIEDVDQKKLLLNQLNELENELNRIKKNKENKETSTLITELAGNLKRIRESGSSWKKYKKIGLEALSKPMQIAFLKLNDICVKYGLFIVPVGELEGWLVEHGVPHTSNKSKWIIDALNKIPDLSPELEKHPWLFMQNIFKYLGE